MDINAWRALSGFDALAYMNEGWAHEANKSSALNLNVSSRKTRADVEWLFLALDCGQSDASYGISAAADADAWIINIKH